MRGCRLTTAALLGAVATMSACAQIAGIETWQNGTSSRGGSTATTTSQGGGSLATTSNGSTSSGSTSSSVTASSTTATTSGSTTSGSTGTGPTCNGVCLSPPPGGGWSAPVKVVPGGCPGGTTLDTTVDPAGVVYLQAPAPCSNCACSPPASGECSYTVDSYTGGNCMSTLIGVQPGVTDGSCIVFGGSAGSALVSSPTALTVDCTATGSCTPTTSAHSVCTVMPPGSCSAGEGSCVPSGAEICVWSTTNHTCAAPYAKTFSYYETPGSCCGTVQGAGCSVNFVKFNTGNGCMAAGLASAISGCFNVAGATPASGVDVVSGGPGSCTPPAASYGTPVTVCCNQ